MNEKPVWICSYRGAADYTWRGKKYVVRSFGCPGTTPTPTSEDGHYNGDYYRTGILPCVGTVMCDYSGGRHEFPPAELCANFPNHVPARWTEHFATVEYATPRAPLIIDTCGYATTEEIARQYAA
jgi:hypothetical protein